MPLKSAMQMHPRMSPLQIMLLIQLEASPKYGYEMLKSIKQAFEGIWEPRTGTIYPALKSLERRALVETMTWQTTRTSPLVTGVPCFDEALISSSARSSPSLIIGSPSTGWIVIVMGVWDG